MRFPVLKFEHLLFLLAFILALGVRTLNLGVAPLSDSEASWALQALQAAGRATGDEIVAWGPQPGFVILTGIGFALFGSSNALARLVPALLGSLLVLAPLFFRRELGRIPALILAFGLALDPGLVIVSRQIGGPAMALSFGMLSLGWWRIRQPLLAGIFTGMALLSGPDIFMGAAGLGIAWGLTALIERTAFRRTTQDAGDEITTYEQEKPGNASQVVFFSAGTAVLLAGTLFFRSPQGLAAWFGALPTFLGGWANPSSVTPLQLLAALMIYQPIAVVFGLLGGVRGWLRNADREETGSISRSLSTLLLFWAVTALILAFLYPARQVSDLVWVLVPLWSLAACELARYLPDGESDLVSLGQAGLIFVLLAVAWLTLAGLSNVQSGTAGNTVRLSVIAGILALGGLTTLLVSLGWSWGAGRRGLVWGLVTALGIYSLGALFGATQLRPNQPQELWSTSPATGEIDLFEDTLGELSKWQTGFRESIEVVSVVDVPSLRWVLRDFARARFISEPAPGELPPVMITRQQQDIPSLSAAYRGQDFSWWVRPGWTGALPPDPVRWLTYREAPLQKEQIILWARSDLFPGGSLDDTSSTPEQP